MDGAADALPRRNRTAAIKIVGGGIDQIIDGAALFHLLGAGRRLDICWPEFGGIDERERDQLSPCLCRRFRRGLDRAQCRVGAVIGNQNGSMIPPGAGRSAAGVSLQPLRRANFLRDGANLMLERWLYAL